MTFTIDNSDLDLLYGRICAISEKLLEKHGEFFPFGMSLTRDGQLVASSAECAEQHPDVETVRQQVTTGMSGLLERGEIRGYAIATNVTFLPPGEEERTDAVQITLRHESGEAMEIFATYEDGEGGRSFGKVYVSA